MIVNSIPSPTRTHRSLTQKLTSPSRQDPNSSQVQLSKFFSQNSSPVHSNSNIIDKMQELKEQCKRLANLNTKLVVELELKDRELKASIQRNSAKQSQSKTQKESDLEEQIKKLTLENSQLRDQIKQLEDQNSDMVKEYNREISELKSNMRNSIFEYDSGSKDTVDKPISFAHNSRAMFIESASKSDRESELEQIKERLNQLEGKNSDDQILKLLKEIQMQLNEMLRISQQEHSLNLTDSALLQIVDQFDDISEDGEPRLSKIIRLLHQYLEAEIELEDWKRDYWVLEKKLNQLEQEGTQATVEKQIEINFDFTNNHQSDQLKKELDEEKEKAKRYTEEIEQLKSKLQVLQSSNNKFSEHFKNLKPQQMERQFSPVQFTAPGPSTSPLKRVTPTHFYPVSHAPSMVLKQQRSNNPFQFLNISKLLQQ